MSSADPDKKAGADRAASGHDIDRYLATAVAHGFGNSVPGLRSYLEQLFAACPVEGRRVLDVGAGNGLLSLYCLVRGARSVVAMEPEASGSTAGAGGEMSTLADLLGVAAGVTHTTETLQEFSAPPSSFDLVLFHNSVNHVDEEACIRLRSSPAARARYKAVFAKLATLCDMGADVLITDASRRNLFASLHLRNPFAPTIEWEKHQTPRTWSGLLEDAGFEVTRVRWSSFGRLGRLGRIFFTNPITAFLLHSQFVLQARRR
jgi:hypothetical protein